MTLVVSICPEAVSGPGSRLPRRLACRETVRGLTARAIRTESKLQKRADHSSLPGGDGGSFTCEALVRDGQTVSVVFAPGSLARAVAEARALGRRVLLISGRHEGEAASVVGADLGAVIVGWIDRVAQHVPVGLADEATNLARATEADVLMSIGGGSATGLAKAVARQTGLPILAVPTTYAGSEMTDIWGESHGGRKLTGRDPRVLPRVVIYDPALTVSLPPALTAASGMNALAHALEALYAPDRTALSDAVAEEAIATLARGLPQACEQPENVRARSAALRGAWLGGWALGSTSMGLHHKLTHELGGTYGLPHADVHAVILPYVASFNAPAASEAFHTAARALGLSDPPAVGPALFDLARRLSAPRSLAELGLSNDAVGEVARTVAEASVTNPRAFSAHDLESLLQQAYGGEPPHAHGRGPTAPSTS
jgi:maleylacetate reductase